MTERQNRLAGRIALVTGAASGIGRALAVELARRGVGLALADIDVAGLGETRRLAEAAAPAGRVTTHALDVADRAAVTRLPETIADAHGGLDLLINNAGVALGGAFADIDEADFDWLLSINLFGVVRMSRAFLPLLRASHAARIVNMSSLFGLIAVPGQTAYAASKFAVRGFSESLRHELAPSGIGVTTVHPGGVATSIAANARAPRDASPDEVERNRRSFAAKLRLPPGSAARTIADGIARGRPRIIVGTDAKIAATIERLMPVSYWQLIKRLGGAA